MRPAGLEKKGTVMYGKTRLSTQYQKSFQTIPMTKYAIIRDIHTLVLVLAMIHMFSIGVVVLIEQRDGDSFLIYSAITTLVYFLYKIARALEKFFKKKMKSRGRNRVALWWMKMWSGVGTAIGAAFVIIGYLGLLHDHTYFAITILCLLAVFINIRIARQFRFIRLDCENKWKEITIIIESHIILFLLGACIMEFWFPEHISVVLLHLMFLIGCTPYSTNFYMASVSGSSTTYEALEDIELGVVEMGSANEESHGNPSEGDDNWI